MAGFSLIFMQVVKDKLFNGLILGAGAGILGKFITNYFPAAKFDMVDISAETIKVTHFALLID